MAKGVIECPNCNKEIRFETEMYLDRDVCYDVNIEEADAVQVDDIHLMKYKCNKCNKKFSVGLDSNAWGDEDIELIVIKEE